MPVYEYYCDNWRREVAVTLSIGSMTKACLPVRSAAAKTFILS